MLSYEFFSSLGLFPSQRPTASAPPIGQNGSLNDTRAFGDTCMPQKVACNPGRSTAMPLRHETFPAIRHIALRNESGERLTAPRRLRLVSCMSHRMPIYRKLVSFALGKRGKAHFCRGWRIYRASFRWIDLLINSE